MKYRGSEIVVGAFVLAGLAVILVFVFMIRGFGYRGLMDYHVRYANAAGIVEGAPVKYNGMLRGRVKTMEIDKDDPTRIRVEMIVKKDTPITSRTIAKITRADILGDPYIDLHLGEEKAGTAANLAASGEQLPEGSEITAGEPFDLQATLDSAQQAIESLSDLAELVRGQVEGVIQIVSRVLANAEKLLSDDNRARIEATLDHLSKATAQVDDLVADNRQRLSDLIESAGRTTTNLEHVTTQVSEALHDILPKTNALLDETNHAVADMRGLIGSTGSVLSSLDVQQINDLLGNLDATTRNLTEFSRDLKDRPYRLIRTEKAQPPRFPTQ